LSLSLFRCNIKLIAMHTSLVLAGFMTLPLLTISAPTQQWTPRARLPNIFWPRQDNSSNGTETCDLTTVQQPTSTLQAPGADLALVLIAVGKGTQNYTCSNATAAPAAIGAVANLFNESCAIASGTLGSIEEDAAAIGAHFFVDTTTPDFDIIGLGNTQAKKVESVPAPQATNVPWLRLEAQQQGTTSAVREIYRLNTVGGVAPANCQGQAAGSTVTVEYQAQYWIYAGKDALAQRRKKRSMGLPMI
jgi:hypothetical protein